MTLVKIRWHSRMSRSVVSSGVQTRITLSAASRAAIVDSVKFEDVSMTVTSL